MACLHASHLFQASDHKLQMALKFEISSSFFRVGIQSQMLRSAFKGVDWSGLIGEDSK